MKKTGIILLVFMILFLLSACATYNENVNAQEPVFDKPNSVVMDAWSSGRDYKDYVKVISLIAKEQITFNVYAFDISKKTWVIIGAALLKNAGDIDTIDSAYNGDIENFRWFAIQSNDGIKFNVQVNVKNHDALFTVFE